MTVEEKKKTTASATTTEESSSDTTTVSTSSSSSSPLSVRTDDDDNPAYTQMFDFLNQVDWTTVGYVGGSDVVELYHCRLQELDMSNFTTWAFPIVNGTLGRAQEQFRKKYATTAATTTNNNNNSNEINSIPRVNWQQVKEEFVLEVLEMRAQAARLCDFTKYQLALPMIMDDESDALNEMTTRLEALARRHSSRGNNNNEEVETMDNSPDTTTTTTRIVFSIVAHRDIEHLQKLVQAIHLPQHYIFIHLERRCPPEWETAVTYLASSYDNVFVLKFGIVVYETDLVSMIQYRMMNWLTQVVDFDYWVSLDGASFPLYSASDLVTHLVESGRQVWLGALLHRGESVDVDQSGYLRNKRLLATRGEGLLKLTVRVPRIYFKTQLLPDGILQFMTKKTNSGNQAIYSCAVVNDLVASPSVRELFALSKYGCCCCLEERTWIAAMGLIGRQEEALEQAAIWQAWGGEAADCKSSMKNAVLTRNATVCFKVEDGTIGSRTTSLVYSHGQYFRGNQTWEYLKNARERGILFARKFDSERPLSMELEGDIEGQLWGTQEGAAVPH